jgi:pimeloyl-ACP methyl ester carboxylesterase
MKRLLYSILAICISMQLHGQDITGQWNGLLSAPGVQLRLVINIEATDSGYAATLDSPDQGAAGIPASSVSFSNDTLTFRIDGLQVVYEGVLVADDTIKGTFTQGGQALQLNLGRKAVAKPVQNRPQEPKPPYPYRSEEVKIQNTIDQLTIAGTLTLPPAPGKYPVAILISGSGPQDRNEEILGHKPFLVLADHLTKNGIAVLRYDDRGTAESTGDFSTATSADFANDVRSIVTYLQQREDIHKDQIGLIGHSEGGLIAPMVAADNEDIAFIVMLAGPAVLGYDILMAQNELIAKANGVSPAVLVNQLALLREALDIMAAAETAEIASEEIRTFMNDNKERLQVMVPPGTEVDDYIESAVAQYGSPWFHYFINYDPAESLTKVKCPVLAINGEKDLQVPAQMNLEKAEEYLKAGGNQDYNIQALPNLNHLFQESNTGSPAEYANIEQTFSPDALKMISDWIISKTQID